MRRITRTMTELGLGYRRYADGCYAITKAGWRGPCAHSATLAFHRWRWSGFVARSNKGA